MKRIKLNAKEKAVEKALLEGEYIDVPRKEFESIALSVASRRKDAVLNIRVNSKDLRNIKQKAKKLGVRYQTFISETLHRLAEI